MSNFEANKASFISYLKEINFKFQEIEDNVITFGMSGDNVKGVKYFVSFDEGGDTINITGTDIASFKDKLTQGFITVNRLNVHYRWIKFVIHEDGDLITFTDAVIEPNTAGKEIMELIGRNINILDEAYPEIMREIWG